MVVRMPETAPPKNGIMKLVISPEGTSAIVVGTCEKRGSRDSARNVVQGRRYCRLHRSVQPVEYGSEASIASGCVINRYYDASTGQFLSVDPLVWKTGMPYSYALNDPINADDPWGLGFCIFGHNGNGGCNGGSLTHFKHILCDVYGEGQRLADYIAGTAIIVGTDILVVTCSIASEGLCIPLAFVVSEVGLVYGIGFIANGSENPNPSSCSSKQSHRKCRDE